METTRSTEIPRCDHLHLGIAWHEPFPAAAMWTSEGWSMVGVGLWAAFQKTQRLACDLYIWLGLLLHYIVLISFFSLSIWGFCWFLSRNCNGWPIQRTGFLRRFWILQCQNPTRRRRFCWLWELKLRVSASPSITVDLFDQLVVDYLNNRSSRYPSIRVSILSSIQLGQLTVDTLADHCFGGSGYGIGRAIAWSLGRIFLKGLDHIPIN